MTKTGRGSVRNGLWLGVCLCLLAVAQVRAESAPTVLGNVPEGAANKDYVDIKVYKYTNRSGVRSYSDVPPAGVRYQVMKFDCFACNPTSTVDWTSIPLQLHAFKSSIDEAARRYRVDPALVRAVIHAESAFRPKARSSKGALGLMQLMPGTARDMGVQNALAPDENIRGGVKYLAMLLDENRGNTRLATAAYNAGPGAVKRYGDVPPYEETQTYVRRVKVLHERYKKAMGKRFSGRVIAGVGS
jgi:soluble lytic murein transglycosylase-like protein